MSFWFKGEEKIAKKEQEIISKKPIKKDNNKEMLIQKPIKYQNNIAFTEPKSNIKKRISPLKDNEDDEEEEEDDDEKIITKLETQKKEIIIIKKKCSLDEHNEIDAIFYCQECKIYMCNKCEKVHLGLLKNHHLINLDKDVNEAFTGICTEPNHSMNLQYYCKTHNKLCCAACIAKIKCKGNGKHKNCKVVYISKIKNKMKKQLGENIKNLEELSNKLEPTIKELKTIFEKINEKKEKLKKDAQILFTKMRNELNNREDALLLEIEQKFNYLFFGEELLKETEKLPNIVKKSLEKGKIKENDWDDENKLNKLIHDCIKIENNIKDINIINDKIKKYYSNKELQFEIRPKEDEFIPILQKIKEFGNINILDKNINLNEVDDPRLMELLNLFDEEYDVSQILEKEEIIEKIKELNYQEDKIREWIEIKICE